MHSKIHAPEKNVISITLEREIGTTFSSPSNSPPVITPKTKLLILKWSWNTILKSGQSMISGIDEKQKQ